MFKKLWEKIKAWAVNTAWPWLKKEWFQIVNLFVIWIAFVSTHGFLHVFVGVWFFVVLCIYLWKFLGLGKLFNKPPVPPVTPTN
jgi:hypothetical protein